MQRATVHVNGIVQSVGFRPFVHRTAVGLDLDGTVRNLGDAGVRIQLEGPAKAIDAFLDALRTDEPPLARVEEVDIEREPVEEARFDTFEILESEEAGEGGGTIPPDTAMCPRCLEDVRTPSSRYAGYWATSCVDCGPRFTVIHDLPYDRPTTSMAAFPMCEACRQEYEDPTDRRHHAQTIACPECGPRLAYAETIEIPEDPARPGVRERDPLHGLRGPRRGEQAVEAAAQRLAEGGIVVVKGIGGAHLACRARDPEAVGRLRERTERPAKPFALMAPTVDSVETFADVGPAEAQALTSPRRPILLLEQDPPAEIAFEELAPGLHNVGVMLAYTGLHHLLFEAHGEPLVMTSANLPGRPMHVHNAEILAELDGVADGFLLHDRTIVSRCDDSVGRHVDGSTRWIRRSRGLVPVPVQLPASQQARILALGPELDVAAALLAGSDCYLTQYVGHVDDLATFAYLERAIESLTSLTNQPLPSLVACDQHPGFRTSEHARSLRDDEATPVEDVIEVQHHHAHAASVLAEHGLEQAIAITLDGVGYGPDGTVWGGEVLHARRESAQRVAGLSPMRMPGGDRATRFPARMLAGALHPLDLDGLDELLAERGRFPRGDAERELVLQQLAKDVNAPVTTSAGRFLDAVSALLDVCQHRRYEGEPAIRLEAAAREGDPLDVAVPRTRVDERPAIDAPELLHRLVHELEAGAQPSDVAATAQEALAEGIAELAIEAAHERGIETVALSGGVAYNQHVHSRARSLVEGADLVFASNEAVPPGDGGIAYGQAAVAAARGSS